MQPRVIAVLVARNGAKYLPRTLSALAAQTRRPDAVLLVDSGSTDASEDLLAQASAQTLNITKMGFATAITEAVRNVSPAVDENDWLWFLGHDNAPEPGALAALVGAVEVAPSVAVAGPKLMRWDEPRIIESYGESLTPLGRSVGVVEHELDQAQHDLHSDLLAVAAGGMLIRRSVWNALGGFDRGLPSVDAALDLCVRARLAGHRVVGVPSARVASAGPIELFGRRSLSAGGSHRVRRGAQLHRRLTWAPALALPFHWLTLLPLAIARSIAHLIGKRPGWIGGEIASAVRAAFDTSVPAARSALRRNRTLGWAAIAPLRMPWATLRERRSNVLAQPAGDVTPRERPGFFASGGAWLVLLAAVIGIVTFRSFTGAGALEGGGLVPLSTSVTELWTNLAYGWREVGAGFIGPPDPFSFVLAVLGSLTFWSPSYAIVLLYLVALPLAALTAWTCASRFATTGWPAGVAALAWALAPPFLASLDGGHLGAVLAHILLPALISALLGAARNWAASAFAAILLAAITASAPVLIPALVLLIVAWAAARPTGAVRILGTLIPSAALFLPLIWAQFSRGTPLAVFVDPGVTTATSVPVGWQLALGNPETGLGGWSGLATSLGLPEILAPVAVVVLLAPFAALALLSLFLPGSRRAVPVMAIALLGFVTAVAGAHLFVSFVDATAVAIWPGAALSLYWLGLVGGVVLALDGLGRIVPAPAILASLMVIALAIPALMSPSSGTSSVVASNGRVLPAYATAEAASRPDLGTLALTPQPGDAVAAELHRGIGTTLERQSTLAATQTELTADGERLALLAGNVASRSGFDVAAEFDELQIGFVLLAMPTAETAAAHQRFVEALDGNRILEPIGQTSSGYLWYYSGLADAPRDRSLPLGVTTLALALLIGQGVIFGGTLLLAIPTTRRRRLRSASVADREEEVSDDV